MNVLPVLKSRLTEGSRRRDPLLNLTAVKLCFLGGTTPGAGKDKFEEALDYVSPSVSKRTVLRMPPQQPLDSEITADPGLRAAVRTVVMNCGLSPQESRLLENHKHSPPKKKLAGGNIPRVPAACGRTLVGWRSQAF